MPETIPLSLWTMHTLQVKTSLQMLHKSWAHAAVNHRYACQQYIYPSQKHIWLWTTEPTEADRVAEAFYGFVSVGVIRSDSISFATLLHAYIEHGNVCSISMCSK